MSKYARTFIELITNNSEIINDLSIIRELALPDCYVAAGYVRNFIWDSLHGYSKRTPLNDIDVIYYNPNEQDEGKEKEYESILKERTGVSIWSVKNQSRMHTQNRDQPYKSTEDAIRYWPETVTAVGIKLDKSDRIQFICPYGLDDLFELKVRQSPMFKDQSYYRDRVNKKNWLEIWPKLEIIYDFI
jgi:hypothetical protein